MILEENIFILDISLRSYISLSALFQQPFQLSLLQADLFTFPTLQINGVQNILQNNSNNKLLFGANAFVTILCSYVRLCFSFSSFPFYCCCCCCLCCHCKFLIKLLLLLCVWILKVILNDIVQLTFSIHQSNSSNTNNNNSSKQQQYQPTNNISNCSISFLFRSR